MYVICTVLSFFLDLMLTSEQSGKSSLLGALTSTESEAAGKEMLASITVFCASYSTLCILIHFHYARSIRSLAYEFTTLTTIPGVL